MDYYVAEGSSQRGPLSEQQLAAMGLRPDTLVWCEGMPQWQPAGSVAALQPFLSAQPVPQPGPYPAGPAPIGYATPGFAPQYVTQSDISGKKIAAGICGILIGTFGVHKFILGLTGGAVTMLVISLVCLLLFPFTCGMSIFALPVMHIIGLVEGIIYLSKSDAEFYQTYMVQKRQWF